MLSSLKNELPPVLTFHEVGVNPLAQTFDVGGMDQEFTGSGSYSGGKKTIETAPNPYLQYSDSKSRLSVRGSQSGPRFGGPSGLPRFTERSV